MKKIKNLLGMIKCNLWAFVGFEFIYKIISLLLISPLFLGIFNLIMRIRGYRYITSENMNNFIYNPLIVILLILLVIFIAIYTMYEIITIILMLDASHNNKNIKVLDIMKLSFKKSIRLFKPTNWPLAFIALLINPFLNIGLTSSFFSTVKIPEYLLSYILDNLFYTFILIFITLIFACILVRWLYALYYFVLEDKKFILASKLSKRLCEKKYFREIINIILLQLIVYILYILFICFGIVMIFTINKLLSSIMIIKTFITTIIWVFLSISYFIFIVISLPLSYAGISAMFYHHKEERNENINYINYKVDKPDEKMDIIFKRITLIIISICLILGFIFTYGYYNGRYNLNINHIRRIQVTAHRGDSKSYPENTMSAFKSAKKKGADYIELDVRKTKDGKVIVMHDSNLKRTAGKDENIWDVNYNDIRDLDVGSFLNKKFKDERIPLLEDVIVWAKNNNIYLNIEIKPSSHDKNLILDVVKIIEDEDFINRCVITSSSYDSLKEIKEYSKDIQTVYVLSFAYGDISLLDKADGFSIEATYVNSKLVKSIHKIDKELYVWTVNSEGSIKKMIDLNVDNIVTDNVTNAKNIIYSSMRSNLISEYIKYVEYLFL